MMREQGKTVIYLYGWDYPPHTLNPETLMYSNQDCFLLSKQVLKKRERKLNGNIRRERKLSGNIAREKI